jgi:hypothetical protein
MNTAFQQFSKCLADFSFWGYTGEDATIAQRWHGAMKLMQQALDAWWAPWATRTGGQAGDVLPNDVDVKRLADILQDVAMSSLNAELAQPGGSRIVLGEGARMASPGDLTPSDASDPAFASPTNLSYWRASAVCSLQSAEGNSPQVAAEFQREVRSAPTELVKLHRQTSYAAESEVQGEVEMQALTLISDDGADVFGRKASRALLVKAVAAQREHDRGLYRHGRAPEEGKSMPLQRRLDHCIFHKLHGQPTRSREEGDDIDLVPKYKFPNQERFLLSHCIWRCLFFYPSLQSCLDRLALNVYELIH